MPTIRVLSGGGFNEQIVTSTTVSALRSELNIDVSASVNVNGQGISDGNHPINDDDVVAAVNNNKTGGK